MITERERVKCPFSVYAFPMTTSVKETERKYEAPDGVRLPAMTGLPGVAATAGPHEQLLEAVYYDTGDLRLASAGLTLRRRTGGDDAGWHLKLPAGVDTREELRLPPGGEDSAPPEELGSLVRVHTRGGELAPVALISTERQRWQLVDGRGDLLVEVVEDRVSATGGEDGDEARTWREVEVELGERGTVALLDAVERRLKKAGMRRSRSSAKLTRLLGDRVPARPTGPDVGRKSAGGVVLAYLREQADALRAQDPRVRRDEPDAVHAMRVATRRMRSALKVFGGIVDKGRTADLAGELKWLAGVLGQARDLEVLRERFELVLDGLEPELRPGPVAARLTRHFAPREAQAKRSAVEALDSPRYFALLDAVDALLADPPLTRRARGKAKDELPGLAAKSYRKLAAQVARAHDDAGLHEARKGAKRLRYAVEAVEPLHGKPARRYRRKVKAVQTLLGDHQDSVVARPVLRQLGAEAGAAGENGFAFGVLHGLESQRAALVEERFPALWAGLGKPKFA